jgi:hypothetical protein
MSAQPTTTTAGRRVAEARRRAADPRVIERTERIACIHHRHAAEVANARDHLFGSALERAIADADKRRADALATVAPTGTLRDALTVQR